MRMYGERDIDSVVDNQGYVVFIAKRLGRCGDLEELYECLR